MSKISVIDYINTPYNQIWVYEMSGERCLSFIDPTIRTARQSCMAVDHPLNLTLTYYRLMMGALYINPNPQNILVIGLGGGIIINTLSSIFPDAIIDIVEINKYVIDVAKKYFSFNPSKNIRVFTEDGFKFVEELPNRPIYDLIMADAFTEDYVPMSFLTEEFVSKMRDVLKPGGVVAVNTFENSKYYNLESALYKKVFNNFYSATLFNRIIFAIKDRLPNMDEIAKNAEIMEPTLSKVGVKRAWLLPKFVLND